VNIGLNRKHKSVFDVFPYVAIGGDDEGNDVIYSEKPDKITAVFELGISSLDDEDTLQIRHDQLMSFLCDLPPNTIVSIYYCKLFFSAYPTLIQKSSLDIVNYMEKNKFDSLLSRRSPEFSCFMAISLPVPSKKKQKSSIIAKLLSLFFSQNDINTPLSDDDDRMVRYKETYDQLQFAVKGLMSSIQGYICRLKKTEIIFFLSKILNHEYIGGNEFTDIIKSDFNCYVPGIYGKTGGYVYYNNTYNTVLSLRGNTKDSKYPQTTSASLNETFLHKYTKPIPFVVQHTMVFPEKSVGLKKARRRENMIATRQGIAKYFKHFEKTPEGLPPEKLKAVIQSNIAYVEETNAKFVDQFFHVHLWDKNTDLLDKKVKTFKATMDSTYKLQQEAFNIKSAYFALFPGNEHVETIMTTIASFNAADFMPLDLPRWPFFDRDNTMEIYYHNETDSFCKVSLFDEQCTNYNAIVAGGSGSGKSFTEQDKLWQAMKYDPCIAIIDFGGDGQGSYLSFVKNLKGTYLEINLHSEFSLNPFEGAYYIRVEKDEKGREIEIPDINGSPSAMLDTLLMGTLERMARGKKTEPMPDNVRYELNQCIKKYYKAENNNDNNTCNLSDFAEKYLKDNSVFVNSNWDLYKGMYEFIGEGQNKGAYANFFRGRYEVRNKDIVCFDMAGLKGHDRLKEVLIPALINMVMTNILGDPLKRDRKKYIIMDEAWRELQGGDMAEFMVEMFRTIRKLNGQITILTQSLNDLFSSSLADALITNTSYFWLIGSMHSPEHLRRLSVSGKKPGSVKLSEYDINQIIEQQNQRDIYLLSPYFKGQLRFYPTPEFIALASTKQAHKEVLRKVMHDFGVDHVTPEVIERVKNDPVFKK